MLPVDVMVIGAAVLRIVRLPVAIAASVALPMTVAVAVGRVAIMVASTVAAAIVDVAVGALAGDVLGAVGVLVDRVVLDADGVVRVGLRVVGALEELFKK